MNDDHREDRSADGRPPWERREPGLADERTLSDDGAPIADLDGARAVRPVSWPDAIAGFRIVGRLGEGGMGVVWEAEQESPRRRVALKVMRRDHVVDELHVRMFHREAASLARLKHPNIAAIYGSGHSEDGHDYFAMELVRGQTLDRWIAARPRQVDGEELRLRLRMFRTVCDAVHYAHLRGVIHRDLKPSNIIVTEEDEVTAASSAPSTPTLKILDFGLARITDADVAATTVSEIGMIKGTLPYMSPEQARGDVEAIDPRTDVYALGVILYELLTGRRPYDVSRAALAAAVRVICEEPPQPLRATFSGTRRLDRDVETIVGRSLEKEPERRYASAAALAEDVQRYLELRPIVAHPPSAAYQLRKFTQRHRALVLTAASVLLALLVGLGTTTWGFRTARAEAARSRQVAGFLEQMLAGVGPTVAQGADTSLLESILEQTAARVDGELADQPRVAAALHETLGRTYLEVGDYAAAERHLPAALDLKRRLYGEDHPEALETLRQVALMRQREGRVAEAEDLLRQLLRREREAGGARAAEAASVACDLGILLYQNDRAAEAAPLLEESLEVRRRLLGERSDAVYTSMAALGLVRIELEQPEEAERLLVAALDGRRELLGETHPHTLDAIFNLAGLYTRTSRLDDAERLNLEALARMEEVYGADHPKTIQVRQQVGAFYRRLQRLDVAETYVLRALEDARTRLGEDHPMTVRSLHSLGNLRRQQGRLDEAGQILGDVLERFRRIAGPDDPATLNATMSYLQLLAGAKRHDAASALAAELVATARAQHGDRAPATLLYLNEAAHVWAGAGELERSAAAYREALEGRRELLGAHHPDTLVSLNSYAVLRMREGDFAAARPLLEQALAAQTEVQGADHPDTVITLYNLAHAALNLDDPAQAEQLFAECVERWGRSAGPLHPYTLRARGALADLLLDQGRLGEVEPLLRDTAEQLLADPEVPDRIVRPVVERLATASEQSGRPDDAAAWRARLERS